MAKSKHKRESHGSGEAERRGRPLARYGGTSPRGANWRLAQLRTEFEQGSGSK